MIRLFNIFNSRFLRLDYYVNRILSYLNNNERLKRHRDDCEYMDFLYNNDTYRALF